MSCGLQSCHHFISFANFERIQNCQKKPFKENSSNINQLPAMDRLPQSGHLWLWVEWAGGLEKNLSGQQEPQSTETALFWGGIKIDWKWQIYNVYIFNIYTLYILLYILANIMRCHEGFKSALPFLDNHPTPNKNSFWGDLPMSTSCLTLKKPVKDSFLHEVAS